MTKDPMNQVYASWLCTIAGEKRDEIWSSNRERIGDIVETGLGVCKLIDEHVDTLGPFLGDPNSMSNRIETSIIMFMDSKLQRHYNFGKNRPPKGPHRKVNDQSYPDEMFTEADEMLASVVTIEDVLGPRQVRKIFAVSGTGTPTAGATTDMEMTSDEDTPVEQRTCKPCGSGKTVMKCDCMASTAWRT